ncbi:glycoside hydrolase TIM-barrel-like domain-containing protein [Halocynthiibacter sp. C4]|uniref:baseplate multidomain protein megatron n=1 Tax=Halocynthiibacter sp. C4 TaxID=2992758 RepID=UPI00237A41A3|nr:glycoside hydrolase TIM-barrel-like domain-containing protein [Halocynthiibacter sp. C4]MDE0589873.1 glycoside hydrolase TIM-barrel-like domain-containing protein [Halocynthiibacter sp. C4]
MATVVLAAVGYSVGASLGGAAFGISSAIIGRAVGATVGRMIDQRLLGGGSQAVETGRVDRFRLTGASEGAPIPQIYGRMRTAGQVIWASEFSERKKKSGGGGGKGGPKEPEVTSYSYSVSAAVALCEGEISGIGRVWADGVEIARDDLNMRVYSGSQDQMPDPKIEAVEGAGNTPAYRGIAYVVFENLQLAQFGNRFPQFNFEVLRPAQVDLETAEADPVTAVEGVALIPGTGEYALATTPVHYSSGLGKNRSANVNTPSGKTDFATSMEALRDEMPKVKSVSLVVSWFGDDLRMNKCEIQPKVEQKILDGTTMPWRVSGVTRSGARKVPKDDGRSIYGGTPTDASVVEAISEMSDGGQDIVFYPFILMDQESGNGKVDPYTGAADQPKLPWRGRITLSVAPGQSGSPDQTASATSEVDAFFGTAQVDDFTINGTNVNYTGPSEWSYRRFILHYAHLCKAAGGVAAFCIGSEMRGLTQVRDAANGFPAVEKLRQLAADVRAVLGPECKLSYAADWSEYFGYHPQDGSGDVYFHLDALWADANIDFIGIDNYMPLSDWRDGADHQDAGWGSIHNLEYLMANIEGGEGYDWYYHSNAAERAQIRTPIEDGAHGEDWVWRYKDIRGWWQNRHHNRVGGERQAQATAWVPESKPVWFTEIGCAAIDKGTNQPNKFLDPKSSESSLPKYSDGTRDDLIQMQYLRALYAYWRDPANNPVSAETGVPMIDMSRAHVWAWDARPFPYFPNNGNLWSDGGNYARGHWLNGRTVARSLASVVGEICERSGVTDYDTSALYGFVRGYQVADVTTARSALQPLMLAYGFEAIERDGMLVFKTRDGIADVEILPDQMADLPDQDAVLQRMRAPTAETAGRIRLAFVESDGDFEVRAAEAIHPDEVTFSVSQSELPLALTKAEASTIVERWLAESRVARDAVRFALPMSELDLGAGDVVALPDGEGVANYRIDNVEQSGAQIIDAVRVENAVYTASDAIEEPTPPRSFTPPVPVFAQFLDLPLLTGDEAPHAPHLAVTAEPWPGSVAVYSSAESDDAGYRLNTLVSQQSVIGQTETPMVAALAGVPDNGVALRVKLATGELSSATSDAVLNGVNLAAIGDGNSENWELFQFTEARLVAEDTYELSGRLRGQFGSDAIMPEVWPVGSLFVLLDGTAEQISLATNARGLARNYRIGPATRGYDDPSYEHKVEAFQGIGLRPYAPVHLKAQDDAGDLTLSWIRRARVEADQWSGFDIPLGEDSESYVVRVLEGEALLREATVSTPSFTYTAAMQASDGGVPDAFEVAQISQRFGAGPFRRKMIND